MRWASRSADLGPDPVSARAASLRENGTMSSPQPPSDDPRPTAPVPPELEACCGNGCDPCIFDLHDLAMDEYRQALRAWQARQPQSSPESQ